MADRSIEYAYALIDKYSSVADNMTKHTQKFERQADSSFSKVMKKINLFGINVGSILSAKSIIEITKKIFSFGKGSVQAFEEVDEANRMVQKTLDITKNKVGKTFQELNDQATELQNKTFFGDDEVLRNATTNLLRFTSITGKEFNRIQKLSLDVAAGMKGVKATQGDLSTSARYVAMAYEKPENAMRMLRSLNILLSDSENKMISNWVKNGNVVKAREFILKKIEDRYKGMSEELALSSAGMDRQTKNIINDMQEVIGEGLIPLKVEFQKGLIATLKELTPIIITGAKGFKYFFEHDWGAFVKLFKTIKSIITGIFLILKPELKEFGKAFHDLFMALLGGSNDLLTGFGGALKFIAWLFKPLIVGLTTILKLLKWLGPVAKIIGGIAIAFAILNAIMAINPIIAIAMGIIMVIGLIVMLIKNWGKVVDFMKNTINTIWEYLSNLLNNPFIVAIGTIFLPFITIPLMIIKHWDKVKKFFVGLGKIVMGLIDGMKKFLGIKDKASNINSPGLQDYSKMPHYYSTNQKVNVKTDVDITVRADKGTKVTKIKKKNTGTQK